MKALKAIVAGLLILALVLLVIYLVLPKGPGELMDFDDPYRTERILAKG